MHAYRPSTSVKYFAGTAVKTQRVTAHPSLNKHGSFGDLCSNSSVNEQTPRMGYRGLGSAAPLCWCNTKLGLAAEDGLYISTIDVRHKNDLGTNITHRSTKLVVIRMAYLTVCAGKAIRGALLGKLYVAPLSAMFGSRASQQTSFFILLSTTTWRTHKIQHHAFLAMCKGAS